jgi:hypothetical protein
MAVESKDNDADRSSRAAEYRVVCGHYPVGIFDQVLGILERWRGERRINVNGDPPARTCAYEVSGAPKTGPLRWIVAFDPMVVFWWMTHLFSPDAYRISNRGVLNE